MQKPNDPLLKSLAPDRVWYAFGALLDEEDFTCEQTYHRGRMGRVLAYLHGSGTVAGLKVMEPTGEEELLMVMPGLAVDRLGRLIEVTRAACLRLSPWLENRLADPMSYDALANSHRPDPDGGPDCVVVDIFLKFEICPHAKQPAFAAGNLEALNAVAPSRIRDGYRLELCIREEDSLPLPEPGFPDLAGLSDEARRERIVDYKLENAWKETTLFKGLEDALEPLPEHAPGQDGTELLLARLWIPAAFSTAGSLERTPTIPVRVDNGLRTFSFSAAEMDWLTNAMR